MDFDEDNIPLTFGKYKGESPNDIAEHDPGYVVWLYENKPELVSRTLAVACDQESGERKLSQEHYPAPKWR